MQENAASPAALFLRRLGSPFQPLAATLATYSRRKLGRDALAGLTVSVVEVPQAMAYALIAGVPPVYGLYTSIIQGFLGAIFSGSQHLTTGPTNTHALLIASVATRLLNPGDSPQVYLQIVVALTLVKGLLQLGFAAAQFGQLVKFVSRSVIAGISAGAGVLIAIGQIPNLLGIQTDGASRWPGVVGTIDHILPHLNNASAGAMLVGAISLAACLLLKPISRFMPWAILAVAAGTIFTWLRGLEASVPLIGPMPENLFIFAVPAISFEQLPDLLPGALALAIIGMLESVSIAKTIATKTGDRIVADREFFAQGLANSVSAFFQCMPGTASFTRSALDHAAGAVTRFAAVFNAIFVAMIFLLFSGVAARIPLASLAAVLMVVAYQLIDWPFILRLARASRADLNVFLVTCICTLLIPLEYAIFAGIFFNIAVYLRTASQLHLAEMVSTPGGSFQERPLQDRGGNQPVIFLHLEGNLFFGVADELQDRLTQIVRSQAIVLIIRLKRTHAIDATVLHVLEEFAAAMRARNRHLVLCGVKSDLMQKMNAFGLVKIIGAENVFLAESGIFTSAKKAINRARELVGRSIDDSAINVQDSEAWAYEI